MFWEIQAPALFLLNSSTESYKAGKGLPGAWRTFGNPPRPYSRDGRSCLYRGGSHLRIHAGLKGVGNRLTRKAGLSVSFLLFKEIYILIFPERSLSVFIIICFVTFSFFLSSLNFPVSSGISFPSFSLGLSLSWSWLTSSALYSLVVCSYLKTLGRWSELPLRSCR